jgi:hypothetical protein
MSIIKAQNLDLSTFTFSEPKVDVNTKAKRIFVNNNGGKVIIQTPKMYVPNGVQRWRKPDAIDNKDDSFELEMSFGGDSADVAKFHEKMQEYDTIVKDQIQKNSLSWIGKQKASMETIEDAFYIPTVKLAVDKNKERVDYPDRMKAKIDRQRLGDDFTGEFVSNKRFNTKVLAFDDKKEQLDFNENTYDKVIPKGSHIVCILELVYIFCSKQVSTKWKLVQFKVFRGNSTIDSYAIDDSDEEENKEEADEAEEARQLTEALKLEPVQESWADSVPEEGQVQEEEEPEPEQEPEPVVKKTVRKKKTDV